MRSMDYMMVVLIVTIGGELNKRFGRECLLQGILRLKMFKQYLYVNAHTSFLKSSNGLVSHYIISAVINCSRKTIRRRTRTPIT